MSKLKISNCENCRHYDPDECYCMAIGEHEVYPEDTCDNWEADNGFTEEELEAARTDAAERENHRKEVEGEIE